MSSPTKTIEVRILLKFDPEKMDAYNASLFSGPEYNDPVQGNGTELLCDIVRSSTLPHFHSELDHLPLSASYQIDGKDVEL